MSEYVKPLDIRWADLDPNMHMRHSVYYDYGAFARISFLEEQGLTVSFMAEHFIGPILFREECVFRKEIRLGDKIAIDLQLLKAKADHSRWSIRHRILKDGDTVAAVITVDGAWIDVNRRRLAVPPEKVKYVFDNMPRAEEFSWIN
jgi:acyl-CoA thioester hydrolase